MRDKMEKTGMWNAGKEDRLRRVVFDLGTEWEIEEQALRERLQMEGIACASLERQGADPSRILEPATFEKRGTVVLTDSAWHGKKLAQEGIVYFGCRRGESSWFEGAALVLEGFEEIDARYLEEWMCRAQGRPAWIARTERLRIREIGEQDLPELVRIGEQAPGLALRNEEAFTLERLRSYIETAYRLQGYGLWSVLYEGKVIGCCGFAPYEEKDTREQTCVYWMHRDTDAAVRMENGENGNDRLLELQYMLDAAYRWQGFGTEMCRAALQYADERLEADEIRVRIHPGNVASQALARTLGFIQKNGL